jgi:membrane protein YqaA with SNARE-associated domain
LFAPSQWLCIAVSVPLQTFFCTGAKELLAPGVRIKYISWNKIAIRSKAGGVLGKVLQVLYKYMMLWGIPGLFGIAFFDAASVPLVGGPDAAVLLLSWQSWQHPMQVVLIVLTATIGSSLGYFLLFRIARFGGEMALSRFNTRRKAWMKSKLDQNAFLSVALGVAAPPPFPTKLVILAAGAFNVGQWQFINGLLAGRLFRFAILAYLGARFGNQAISTLKAHFPIIAIVAVVAIVLFLVVRRFFLQPRTAAGEKP